MPNHVKNRIIASEKVLNALKSDERIVDFNKVIQMPDGLADTKAYSGSRSLCDLISGKTDLTKQPDQGTIEGITMCMEISNTLRLIKDGGIHSINDEQFEELIKMMRNEKKHGCKTWYDWAPEHWGTKWNAYEAEKIDGGVEFDTAWSAPHPVIEELSKMFPTEKIEHLWSDEDIGCNLGHKKYLNGSELDLSGDISDPVDFALKMHEDWREDYCKNPETGLWEYKENGNDN